MAWIAACSGKRGLHQEVIMTEERQQFRKAAIEYLRDPDAVIETHVQARIADEIEQLVSENRKQAYEIEQLATKLSSLQMRYI